MLLNAYYPWGLELKGINVNPTKPNNFKYNRKETQAETAWMDYGARMYDAQIGRWNVIDPLSELYYDKNVYGYVSNNPINLIDTTGMGEESTGINIPTLPYSTEIYGNVTVQGDEGLTGNMEALILAEVKRRTKGKRRKKQKRMKIQIRNLLSLITMA